MLKGFIKIFTAVFYLIFISVLSPYDAISMENFSSKEISKSVHYQKLEEEIIHEMNKVRTNPSLYAESTIKPMLKRFIGKKYNLQNRIYSTKEGVKAVEECYKVLLQRRAAGILHHKEELRMAAEDHVRDQGHKGIIGHTGNDNSSPLNRVKRYLNSNYLYVGENISYGLFTAQDIVSFLLINDGMPSRGHREILLNPKFNLTGVACGYHKVYETMCVILFGRVEKE